MGGVVCQSEALTGSSLTDTESITTVSTSWERDPPLGLLMPQVHRMPLTSRFVVFFFHVHIRSISSLQIRRNISLSFEDE